jgi:hemerythrin-like domain-containing protein
VTSSQNAIDLIEQDHRQVDMLFSQLESATTPEQRHQIGQQIIRELSIHAAVEEQLLYPVARRYVPSEDLVEHGIEEHQGLKQELAQLDTMTPDSPEYLEGFQLAKEMVQEHVGEEERDILPPIRQALSEEQLAMLGTTIEAAKKTAPTHPHPNIPPKPPLNLLLGPLYAAMDRLRDKAAGSKVA